MKEDAQSIIEAKKLFKDEEVMAQLTIIRANFQVVVHTITSLEERLPLVQSMQLVENLVEKLKLEPFATQLADVLSKNPGYAKAQKISKLLRGSQEDHEGLVDPNSSANMGNCPIVSCDGEREVHKSTCYREISHNSFIVTMGFQVKGNVAIVTGGSQGFGKEFTRQLLKHGAKVCLSDVNSDVGLATETEFKNEFGQENVCFVKADVTSDEDWTNLWNKTEEKLGAVSILVNNAGVGPKLGWEKNVDIMLKGVAKGTFLGLERMGKNMSGRIINVASIAGISSGLDSKFDTCGYLMAKHAVIALTRNFTVAKPTPFQQYGVKSYALCPWFANTQLVRSSIGNDLSKLERATRSRVLTPEEVGETLITVLEKDKNGACYLVFPDIPLVDFPNCNENLFAFSVVTGMFLLQLDPLSLLEVKLEHIPVKECSCLDASKQGSFAIHVQHGHPGSGDRDGRINTVGIWSYLHIRTKDFSEGRKPKAEIRSDHAATDEESCGILALAKGGNMAQITLQGQNSREESNEEGFGGNHSPILDHIDPVLIELYLDCIGTWSQDAEDDWQEHEAVEQSEGHDEKEDLEEGTKHVGLGVG
eukprot:maker-scaffold193_size270907-snap-gene-0.11 protein:Tk01086 transcript:maker-scaffold193_size270907-snap-gene-0.11-mRNA-1 annotation:"15-hydroxyprostaglandin dehydrogenase"